MVDTGQHVPEVKLVDTERKQVDLASLAKGKKTVIAFFPAAFTGVCTKEMCTFRDGISNLNSLGANVVAISVDSPFSNKTFKEQNKLQFAVLSDYSRDATRAFGVELPDFAGLPGYVAAKRAVFVTDSSGIIRWKWISDNPGLEPDYAQINAELGKIR